MKCPVCNAELNEGQSFCSYCGTKIEAQTVTQPPVSEPESIPVSSTQESTVPQSDTNEEKAAKSALLGLIFGILSIAVNCIGLIFGIIGIVNSTKGLKSATRKGMAIPGLITSIIGTASSIFSGIYAFAFLYGILIGIMRETNASYYLTMIANNLPF